MKKYRILQLVTGFNAIHHILYGNGIKVPFLEYGYFKKYGFRNLEDGRHNIGRFATFQKAYHNCTITNRY